MSEENQNSNPLVKWWQNRIIRTKILIAIFVGVSAYQGISTAYQMRQVEPRILETYKEKALNLSVAVDCIMLKDGILFFNLLDRISRTEVVGIKIDDNHPSCVERTAYLNRLKSSFLAELEQETQNRNPSGTTEDGEEIEVIEEVNSFSSNQNTIPLDLTFNTDEIQGEMEATEIEIDGKRIPQLLYTVKVNGVDVTFDLTDLPRRKLDRFLTLTGTAAGNLLVLFIIIWLISSRMVKPLKQLTDFTQGVIRSGSIEKGEEVQLVKTRANDEIGILTRTFNQMITRLRDSYRQIIKSKAAIGDLLDNTGQGFFSFEADYKINEEYSKACETFFQYRIEDLDALDLMVPERKSEVKQLMDLLFSGAGSLDLLEDLLPKEIELHERILSVEYRHIPAKDTSISDKIMVILTDITQEKALREMIEKDEAVNELIVKIARDKDGFIQFVQDAEDLILKVIANLNDRQQTADRTLLMRHFHTIKGVSASYGLKNLSEKAHQVEESIQELPDSQDPEKTDSLIRDVEEMRRIIRSSLDGLEDIITWDEIDDRKGRIYKIPQEKVSKLERMFRNTSKISFSKVKSVLEDLKKQPIQPILKKYVTTASSLAQKLGKEIDIQIEGEEIEVSHERLGPLFDAVIHMVRNSVDHGLEDPETRMAIGKPEKGTLSLKAAVSEGRLILTIEDDGAGIDPNVIRNLAVKKGIISQKEADSMSKEEAVQLIFKPGFSTTETVSDISGRGVGMDAVKTTLQELGGAIAIKTIQNRGTTFRLSIPQ